MPETNENPGQRVNNLSPTDRLTTFAERVSLALRACAPAENRKGWVIWLSIQSGLSESTIENLMAAAVDASGPSIDALYRVLGARFHDAVFGCHGFVAFRVGSQEAYDAAIIKAARTMRAQLTAVSQDFDAAVKK